MFNTQFVQRPGSLTLPARVTRVAALLVVAGAINVASIGATTLPESVPDFSLDATRTSAQSAQSGAWSNPSTWQGGRIPSSNDIVRILAGHAVTVDDISATAYTIAIDGRLAFSPTVNAPQGNEPAGDGRRDGDGHAGRS
jgi:G8 domain